MRKIIFTAFFILILTLAPSGYGNEKDLVPDEETARRIAAAVIIGQRGEEFYKQYIINSKLEDGNWIVWGNKSSVYLTPGEKPQPQRGRWASCSYLEKRWARRTILLRPLGNIGIIYFFL